MAKRPRGKRRHAREMAIQMLYQRDLGGSSLEQIFSSFDVGDQDLEPFAHARQLVEGTLGDRESIDELIQLHAENWRLERMPTIDRNILRLAVYEMLHDDSVPKVVVVDEAIELAKKFGSEDSGRFVNGLLDGIFHAHLVEASLPEQT